jgi:hypothetical protein
MDLPNVRFGSEADMCNAPTHVRFTPNSDRKSGHIRVSLIVSVGKVLTWPKRIYGVGKTLAPS